MKALTSFIISFCSVCAAVGGIHMIIPSGKISKSVKYIITLTVITAFLGIFTVNFGINFGFDTKEKVDTVNSAEATVKAVFEKALKDNKINYEKIIIFTDKNKEGGITITKVEIYSSDQRQKILSVIGNSEAYDVEIIG